jgi:hypothetical protein
VNNDNDVPYQSHPIQQKLASSFRLALTIPTWLVLPLLGLFPPVAWYFLWKEKHRHRFFPIILYIYGSLILTSTSIYLFILRPQIVRITAIYSQPTPLESSLGLAIIILLMIYAVAQIILGKFMKKAYQKYSSLPRHWLWGTAIIFVLDTIIFIHLLLASVIVWLILEVYSVTT